MDAHTFRSRTEASAITDPATVDAYTDVPISGPNPRETQTIFTARSSGPISLNWKNTGAQSINSRVLAANDKDLPVADWEVVVVEAAIATTANRHITIAAAVHQFYRFQHQAVAAGQQGATSLRGCHKQV